jgi:hypothetical protein
MKIDLAEQAVLYVESVAYKVLTEAQLSKIIDGNTSSDGIVLSSGESSSIVCNLNARYNLNNIIYYRSQATSEQVVFYGRQNLSDSWEQLDAIVSAASVSFSLSGSTNKYLEIKVIHQVISGTSTIYELEIYSDDLNLGIGSIGTETDISVNYGTDTQLAQAVLVHNRTSSEKEFWCLLDPDASGSTEIKVSDFLSGTYYGLYEKGINLPDDFLFSSGYFVDTVVSSNTVVLDSTTTGIYYSPVIDIQQHKGKRLFWKSTVSGTNEIDIQDSVNSLPTVGLRSSSTSPSDIGWVSGQLSVDSLWSVVSGTLSFSPHTNHTIIEPLSRRYIQFKVEFLSPSLGQTPILEKLGIEEGLNKTISANDNSNFYAKSYSSSYIRDTSAGLIVWFFE